VSDADTVLTGQLSKSLDHFLGCRRESSITMGKAS
jgi:hypothetical protein